MSGRAAGPGSSPGLSTKQKTKLWNRLRKLDALCQKQIFLRSIHVWDVRKYDNLFVKYDNKRKEIRNKLKAYGKQKRHGSDGPDENQV